MPRLEYFCYPDMRNGIYGYIIASEIPKEVRNGFFCTGNRNVATDRSGPRK